MISLQEYFPKPLTKQEESFLAAVMCGETKKVKEMINEGVLESSGDQFHTNALINASMFIALERSYEEIYIQLSLINNPDGISSPLPTQPQP